MAVASYGDMAEEPNPVHFKTRAQWRRWLKKNHASAQEIWLLYYKKHTGKASVPYDDAVEEALCFGWIDGKVRTIDQDRYAQRFSVRRPRSKYSQANIERLRALVRQGRVAKDILPSLPDLAKDVFDIAPDILQAIKANKKAWRNFRRFSQPYVRIRIAFIDAARKRPDEFHKRLAHCPTRGGSEALAFRRRL